MIIIFYPKNIAHWRDTNLFDFDTPITLVPKQKTNHKIFHDQKEFFDFCKEHGVRFTDPAHPFQMTGPVHHERLGENVYTVFQQFDLGWLKYR